MPSGYLKRAEGSSKKQKEGSSTKNSRKAAWRGGGWDYWPGKGENYNKWTRSSGWGAPTASAGRVAHRAPLAAHTCMDRDYEIVPEPKPDPPPPRTFEGFCLVCMDEEVQVLDLGRCEHTACVPCLKRYYTQKDLDIYPLHCPFCEKRIRIRGLERDGIFDEADVTRANRFRSVAVKRDNAHKFISATCPFCRHTKTVRKQASKSNSTVCDRCHEVYSYVTNIAGLSEEVRRAFEKDEAGGLGICPRCGSGVQKNRGCHHMTCRCGAHFEWTSSLTRNLEARQVTAETFKEEAANIE